MCWLCVDYVLTMGWLCVDDGLIMGWLWVDHMVEMAACPGRSQGLFPNNILIECLPSARPAKRRGDRLNDRPTERLSDRPTGRPAHWHAHTHTQEHTHTHTHLQTSLDKTVVSLDGRNSRGLTNTKGTVEGVNIKTLGNILLFSQLFVFGNEFHNNVSTEIFPTAADRFFFCSCGFLFRYVWK